MQVNIQKVYENWSKKGQRYWVAQTDTGERLFIWDPKLADRLVVGGTWDVTVDRSGAVPKITEAEPVAAPPSYSVPANRGGVQVDFTSLAQALENLAAALTWAAALDAAIDYIAVTDVDRSTLDTQKIVEIAERLANGWKKSE